ncbi:transporter substrate-binding domain-containing protein [Paenibacillus montanisoli]|uniref:Amino acid ABC transporter substrate-binding protein n=1 Tax=Paenibacillus montanisoli TaxID=2081970 RepID=A0A328TZC8_9BACL|nr:transporter substrate-binding domain-containing protein [Paenibacillus montanisoli]RAP75789.1 amino acid ABC transporter substrate-binding protein [Paenibacillus montanisoli]
MARKRIGGLSFILATLLLILAACSNSGNGSGNSDNGAAQEGVLSEIKERGKLVAGVKFDTKLFGLKDPGTGEVEGFDIDIAKALAKKLFGDESKLELKEVTSQTRIPMLNNGEIDMIIATMTITEKRKEEVDFSDVYFKAGQSLLVKKGSPIKGLEDVTKDTKVLGVKGATSIKNIEDKVPGLKVQQYQNYQEAFTALKAGQGEVLTTDNAILYGMTKQDPNYELAGDIFTDEPYGIAMKKGEQALVNYVNDFLAELKSSGEYDSIYEQWIGEKPAAQ